MGNIDWTDPKCKISEHFTVGEALYLPSWKVYHSPSDEEKANILSTAAKMELVRQYLDNALSVNCWIRPISVSCQGYWSGKNYNKFVGGANASCHIKGLAVDFTVLRMTCEEARHHLIPKLEEFQIRMEDIKGNWVHVDLGEVGISGKRFFKP